MVVRAEQMNANTETEARRKFCLQHTDKTKLCQASECMGWRWQEISCTPEFVEAVKKQAVVMKTTPPHAKAARYVLENRKEFGLPEKPTTGFCGLAGTA